MLQHSNDSSTLRLRLSEMPLHHLYRKRRRRHHLVPVYLINCSSSNIVRGARVQAGCIRIAERPLLRPIIRPALCPCPNRLTWILEGTLLPPIDAPPLNQNSRLTLWAGLAGDTDWRRERLLAAWQQAVGPVLVLIGVSVVCHLPTPTSHRVQRMHLKVSQ
jgi:hypothetical protein